MKTRYCPDCQIELNNETCYTKGKGRMQAYCKKCLCRRQTNRWIQRKKDAVIYLGGKCSVCGYDKNYAALDFHHLDPKLKEFAWIELRKQTWKTVLNELDKCIILCRNCHAELHNPQATLQVSPNGYGPCLLNK